jgi:hypothetical protein
VSYDGAEQRGDKVKDKDVAFDAMIERWREEDDGLDHFGDDPPEWLAEDEWPDFELSGDPHERPRTLQAIRNALEIVPPRDLRLLRRRLGEIELPTDEAEIGDKFAGEATLHSKHGWVCSIWVAPQMERRELVELEQLVLHEFAHVVQAHLWNRPERDEERCAEERVERWYQLLAPNPRVKRVERPNPPWGSLDVHELPPSRKIWPSQTGGSSNGQANKSAGRGAAGRGRAAARRGAQRA